MWMDQYVSHHPPVFGRVLSLAALSLYCLLLSTSGDHAGGRKPLNLKLDSAIYNIHSPKLRY